MHEFQRKYKNNRLLIVRVAVGSLFVSALISGCFENYGRLKHNADITREFQTHQMALDYQYYYYGRSNMPYAIVGIDRAYHMQSRVWRKADRDTEQFRKMIFWVWEDYRYQYQRNFTMGAVILDPEGKKVGIWYSGLWWAAIRFEENNRIVIMPETPFMGGPQ